MPKYCYQARDPLGDPAQGIITAPTQAEAVKLLGGAGLMPTRVELHVPWWQRLMSGLRRWWHRMRPASRPATLPLPTEPAVSTTWLPSAPWLAAMPHDELAMVPLAGPMVFAGPPLPPFPPAPNRVEAAVIAAVQAGGLRPPPERVDRALGRLAPDDLNHEEREAWLFHRAAAALSLEEPDEALGRSLAAFRAFPDSPRIRLLLAHQHERRGEVSAMFGMLDGIPSRPDAGRALLAAARYAYLWDDAQRGLRYLDPVLDTYGRPEAASAVDAPMLSLGLPPVRETVYTATALHWLGHDLSAARELVIHTRQRLPSVPLEDLVLWLDGREADDFSRLLAHREHEIGFTAGAIPMQLAVLRAQRTADADDAVRIVERVPLGTWHLPWLRDVQLLAVCQIAHRVGEEKREQSLRNEFLRRQPLLFEPHHAVFFNMLDYQERLKAEYRQARHNG
jgi:hypothetical protein